MKQQSKTVQLPNIASVWMVWAVMIVLAVVFSSCKAPTFAGKGSTKKPPVDAGAGATGPGGNGFQGGPSGGPGNNGETPGSTPTPGSGGIDTVNGGTSVTVPMSISYDSTEGKCGELISFSNCYTGEFQYILKYPDGSSKDAVRFFNGTKGKTTVADACRCGQDNVIDLIISANGMTNPLVNWRFEVMASHAHPTDASDWKKFISSNGSPPLNDAIIYLGGFDHDLGNSTQNPWATDTREWNNRDDTRMIFTCQVEQCPKKGEGFKLTFKGQDN